VCIVGPNAENTAADLPRSEHSWDSIERNCDPWRIDSAYLPAVIAFIPVARVLPPGSETFGGLAELVLARNYATFTTQCGGSRESDVLLALRQDRRN
jgi:hypothetical protein